MSYQICYLHNYCTLIIAQYYITEIPLICLQAAMAVWMAVLRYMGDMQAPFQTTPSSVSLLCMSTPHPHRHCPTPHYLHNYNNKNSNHTRIRQLYVFLSVCASVRLPVCPSVRLSFCPSARLSVCPSVRLSVCPSVRLSVCPYVRLSVCPYVRLSFDLHENRSHG